MMAGWMEASFPFLNSCAVMEAVGEVVEMDTWGRWAKRETFLSGVEVGVEERLAVFWGRGGRGAPAGGALDTEGRLFPPVPTLSAAVSPLGDVIPLSLPLPVVLAGGLDPRRALPGCLEGGGAEWTEVVESILFWCGFGQGTDAIGRINELKLQK